MDHRFTTAFDQVSGSVVQVQREGKDVTLVAFGKLVGYNLKAAEILEKEGISCEVSMWARCWTFLPAAWAI